MHNPIFALLIILPIGKRLFTRTPEEYERWIYAVGRGAAEFEVAELVAISRDKK